MIWIIKQTAASFPVSYIQGRALFCFGGRLLLELWCITAQLKCVVKKKRCNWRKWAEDAAMKIAEGWFSCPACGMKVGQVGGSQAESRVTTRTAVCVCVSVCGGFQLCFSCIWDLGPNPDKRAAVNYRWMNTSWGWTESVLKPRTHLCLLTDRWGLLGKLPERWFPKYLSTSWHDHGCLATMFARLAEWRMFVFW